MRLTSLAVLLLLADGSAVAAPCEEAELRETVAEYWADNRGRPGVNTSIYGVGMFNHDQILALSPSDADCLKMAIDARLHVCRAQGAARGVRGRGLKPPRVTPDGTPEGVAAAMRQKAAHVGGEAAKQRNIDNAWRLHNELQADYERALRVRAAAVTEARGLAREYESKGCTNVHWGFVPTALKDEIAPPR